MIMLYKTLCNMLLSIKIFENSHYIKRLVHNEFSYSSFIITYTKLPFNIHPEHSGSIDNTSLKLGDFLLS